MPKIEQFWDHVVEVNEMLHDPPNQNSMTELLSSLKQIDSRLYYHLGSHGNGTDLILSAEGHPDLMPILDGMKDAFPNVENWRVITCYDGLFLFGQRDADIFPHDENGDVLFRMYENGDLMWVSRDVNFEVIFPGKDMATLFSKSFDNQNVRIKMDEYRDEDGYSFEVVVTINMCLTHFEITSFEKKLGEMAKKYGGRNDGWGCFKIEN